MQKATGILQLTITVLLMTIKASDSSNLTYINCYECKFESMNSSEVPVSDVCYNPSAHPQRGILCLGLRCKQSITTCTGTVEDCKGTPRVKVERTCTNDTDSNGNVKADCSALSHDPGNRKSSECFCSTAKCNGGLETSKSASPAKFVSSMVLETMVFALCFVSAMIYK